MQDGSHTPANRLTETCSQWFITSFFDIAHLCSGQLTSVKTKYPLTGITWPYCGLKFRVHQGHIFLWSWPLTKCWFSIGSRAHVRLTCCKQGRVVRKPVNATPGLKVDQRINFSCIQMPFTAFVLCIWDYSNSKQKVKKYTENLLAKLQNSNHDANSRLS